MTQDELNVILKGCEFFGEAFFEQLETIWIPPKSKEKIELCFAMVQGMFLRVVSVKLAKDLEFPESVKSIFAKLDALDKEVNKMEE